MVAVTEGRFSTGPPYLRLGDGPPLLVAAGLTSEHVNPTGTFRRSAVSWAVPFAAHFTVYLVNRRPGLGEGATMSDVAADYAGAVEQDLGGGPVAVHGTSTGGSVVLQLAVDRPELVARLVVCAAACRLSPFGRELQLEVARLTEAGQGRRALATLAKAVFPGAMSRPAAAAGWLAGASFVADDPRDMLRMIAAEDVFDVEPSLGQVRAPTLVLGGAKDPFYAPDLFARTAAGVQDGRAVVLPGRSHMYVAGSKVTAGMALGFLLAR